MENLGAYVTAPEVMRAPSRNVTGLPANAAVQSILRTEAMQEAAGSSDAAPSLFERALAPELVAVWDADQKFTDEQNKVMAAFRSELIASGDMRLSHDNKPTAFRFCQARGWAVDKALTMYRAHLSFRQQYGIDAVDGKPPRIYHDIDELVQGKAAVKSAYPCIHHSVDRYGRPVWIDRPGMIDVDALCVVQPQAELIRAFVFETEVTLDFRLPAASLAAGKYIGKVMAIVDLAGFRMGNFLAVRSEQKLIAAVAQDNYPEMVQRIVVINAPLAFTVVWRFISPLLDKRVREKIVVCGKDYLPTLLELMRHEDIPSFLGGGDETCDLLNERGPWAGSDAIPKSVADYMNPSRLAAGSHLAGRDPRLYIRLVLYAFDSGQNTFSGRTRQGSFVDVAGPGPAVWAAS